MGPTGCGEPNFKGDGLCDDFNNNAECNYDDGDCCPPNPPPAGWDDFCEACECKQPPPTEEPCKDEGSAKFCKKNKKKCKKAKISKQCKKTCNKCGPEPCEDTGSKKQCGKVNVKKQRLLRSVRSLVIYAKCACCLQTLYSGISNKQAAKLIGILEISPN